jgi:hypothetical protein
MAVENKAADKVVVAPVGKVVDSRVVVTQLAVKTPVLRTMVVQDKQLVAMAAKAAVNNSFSATGIVGSCYPRRNYSMRNTLKLILVALFCGAEICVFANNPPSLLFAYFVPNDRKPIPGYVERMDRVMQEVQSFYRQSMISNGYGPLTFTMDHDATGKLKVYLVQGKDPMLTYGRKASGQIRDEVKASLLADGINPNSKVLVIFQVLLDRQGDKTVEIGPYVGTGNNRTGTAWFYDDDRLDPSQLASKAPGGYYMRPCSIGHFNSEYIGGIAHELGHAFGLPHVAGLNSNPKHSLMANGNHTYGDELRDEGAGTCLHPASALLLSHCRSFVGDLPEANVSPTVAFTALRGRYETNTLVLDGGIISKPPAFGIIAYNDDKAISGDYDATGWISRVDAGGHFQLRIGNIQPGDFQLRLQIVCVSGATRTFPMDYEVNDQGVPDTNRFTMSK